MIILGEYICAGERRLRWDKMDIYQNSKSFLSTLLGGGIHSKLPLLFLTILLLAAPAFAAHTSNADLAPEWSPAGQSVDYAVTITNNGPDDIDEVRIYMNQNYTYGSDPCEDKIGWEKNWIIVKQACHYIAENSSSRITPGNSDIFNFTATTPSNGCEFTWEFESRDVTFPNTGSIQYLNDSTSVDDIEPAIIKTVGEPKVACEGPECDYWITQDTEIRIEAYDQGECGISGLNYCEYRYSVDGSYDSQVGGMDWTRIQWQNVQIGQPPHYFFKFKFDEDSEHFMEVRCYDIAGNDAYHGQTLKVDDTPPTTLKRFIGPQKIIDGPNGKIEWIDGVTTIETAAADGGDICHIGVENTFYKIIPADDVTCETSCIDWQTSPPTGDGWTTYTGPIGEIPDSCHVMEYYSVDLLGNIEEVQTNCFFVDKKAPIVDKNNGEAIRDIGEPAFTNDGNPEGEFHWITQNMPITFTCTDQQPHPSGDEQLCYKVSYDYPNWGYITDTYCDGPLNSEGYCCVDAAPFVFKFKEDSMHNLEYYCEDAVEKKSEEHVQYYKVDTRDPTVEKILNKPYFGACPPRPGTDDECFVDTATTIELEIEDEGTCAIDQVTCKWKYNVNGGEWSDWSTRFPINFPEESRHELQIECSDLLGNTWEDTEYFSVDKTPPETTKTYGDPFYQDEGGEWILPTTEITLTVEDAGPHKSGIAETQYRVSGALADRFCNNCEGWMQAFRPDMGPWNTYTSPFTIGEESCHVIEFRSIDNVGKEEEIDWQCVFVDDSAPVMGDKVIGDPQIVKNDVTYITQSTPITMSCWDAEPHPVDHVSLWYRYRISDDCETWGDWTDWVDPTGQTVEKTIRFEQDSCHELEYYCADILGNETRVYSEIDIVDTVGPLIEKTVVGPNTGDCPPGTDDICFIDGVTEIHVRAYDPLPHPVDQVVCDWDYTVTGGDKTGSGASGVTSPFVINFPEESEHLLQIDCYDALGNQTTDVETFFVDKTPPAISKWYSVDHSFQGRVENWFAEWINSDATIFGAVTDAGPHKSGIAEVKYRTTRVNDEYCRNYGQTSVVAVEPTGGPVLDPYLCQDAVGSGDWTTVSPEDYDEFEFGIDEQSCHLIEIFAEDNVEKDSLHKQCVFVDNNAPTPIKTVGEPKTVWDGKDSIFYDIEGFCTEPDNCWRVTLFTPIKLDCTDPEPHPVDHETVCFYVELDAEDATNGYCTEMEGDYNANGDSYCCLESTTDTFFFMEETEHNLKYYCEDALGNIGPIDDEKFKVEGTKFEIELNKKWNLISVPFVLLDNDVETVFSSVAANVESVWAYDASVGPDGTWYVYSPGAPAGANSLKKIIPGWGYWLAAYNPDTLVIGGSLFSPATTPPSRDLKKGWNLIGYYGADDGGDPPTAIDVYDGPDGDGKMAHCALYSLGSSVWDKGWTSLFTYWEQDNPNQWNLLDKTDDMDPGAGYWVSIPEDYPYNVTTSCGFLMDIIGP